MASVTEQLIMRIALIDAVTRPLEGVNNQLSKVKETAQSGFANLAGGGAAILAGGLAIQAALTPAIEMDQALQDLPGTQLSEQTLKQLGDTALQFSVDYGKSATEVLGYTAQMRRAMPTLPETMLTSMTKTSAILGAATKSDAETVGQYLRMLYHNQRQAADAMGADVWAQQVAGMTSMVTNQFGVSMDKLMGAVEGMHSLPSTMGVAMEEQLAILSMLQTRMGEGDAVTQFTNLLEGATNAQKNLGVAMLDSRGNLLPIQQILKNIQPLIDKMGGAKAWALLDGAGLGDGTLLLQQLIGDASTLDKTLSNLRGVRGLDTANTKAKAMTKSWERLSAVWTAIRIAGFNRILPTINAVINRIADAGAVVVRWTRLFPNLTKVVGSAILAIAGLGIVTGAWLMLAGFAKLATLAWALTFGGLTGPILLFKKALAALRPVIFAVNLAMSLNPAVIIIGAILALVAAVALAIIYWDELRATFAVLTDFELLGAFFGGLAETFGPLASQALAPVADFFTLIVGLLGQGIAWLGGFFEQTNQASVGIDNVANAGRRMGAILGAVFDTLLTPWRALIALIKTALDASNQFLGTQFDTGALNVDVLPKWAGSPTDITPPATVVNSPLASYRQQDQSKVPSGGLGQQLIQANAAATTANQTPAKAMHIGEVHNHYANPVTPGEMEQEMWITTK
ncbi:phage tail tape measure protein [Aeromonas hydrophila]